MLSKLLPILMLVIGVGGGVGAGLMLAPEPEPEMMEAEAGAEHAAEEGGSGEAEGHAEAEDAGGHGATEEGSLNEFTKLNNQFVVPVVERDELNSLVVLSLSLETKPGGSTAVHNFEPKLRDGFLRVLFDHANMGGFRGAFTRSEVMDPLRNSLREEARRFLGNQLVDVLILEIIRQDV